MSDEPMFQSRMLSGVVHYDRVMGATIIPWADPLHTRVGLAYCFDSPEVQDRLVYMSPVDANARVSVHVTTINWHRGRTGIVIELGTQPDPDNDPQLAGFGIQPTS